MKNLSKILFLLLIGNFVNAQKTTIYADKYIIRAKGINQTKFITNKAYFKNTFMLGDTTVTQSEPFQVTLNARFDGKLNLGGTYGANGSYLRSGGSGSLPTWGLVDWSEIGNKPSSVNAWAKIPIAGETLLGIGNTNTDKFIFGNNGVKMAEYSRYGYLYGWAKIGVNTGFLTGASSNDFAYQSLNNYNLAVGGRAMFGFHIAMPAGQKTGTYFTDIAKENDGDISRFRFTKYEASGGGNVPKWYIEHGTNNDFSIKKVNIGFSIDTTNSMYINAGKYSFGRSTAINGNKFSFEGTGAFSAELTAPTLKLTTGAVSGSVLTALDSTGKGVWKVGNDKTLINIAELRAYKGQASNQKVSLLGYYAINDGGSGDFYWNSSSIETDNGGTIFQVTGVTTGRWKRFYSNEVNIEWFGVFTNESNQFQKAIDYVSTIKGVLVLSSKSYTISNIILKSNITIIGNYAVITNNSSDHTFTDNSNFIENVIINNINFTGTLNISNTCIKLSYIGNNNIKINNCTFENLYRGINIFSINGLTVNNCKFSNIPNSGLYIGYDINSIRSKNVNIFNCLFTKCGFTQASSLVASFSDNVEINNCDIYNGGSDIAPSSQHHGIYIRSSTFVTILKTNVDGTKNGSGIHIYSSNPTELRCSNIKISNVIITNTLNYNALRVSYTDNINIDNIYIKTSYSNGIYVDNANLIRVNNSQIINSNTAALSGANNTSAFKISTVSDIVVNNNIFTQESTVAINSQGGLFYIEGINSRFDIRNNFFNFIPTSNGWYFVNTNSNTTIDGLFLSNNNQFGASSFWNEGSSNTITNCIIQNNQILNTTGSVFLTNAQLLNKYVKNNYFKIGLFKYYSEQGRIIGYNSSIPVADTWSVGDIIYNTSISAGGNIGWICTIAGSQGTWQSFGIINLSNSVTFDPPSLATLTQTSTTITVTGASVGDYVNATFSNSLSTITLSAFVSASNTITVLFSNVGNSTIDLSSGTLKCKVVR